MARLDAPHGARARAHDQGLRARAAGALVAHALQHVAVGHPGGGEERVVALDEVVLGEDLAQVVAGVDGGYDLERVLTQDDLVTGQDAFFSATGVTDGDVLQGVRYEGARGATTESLVMRTRSGTVRRIQSRHDRSKLRGLTGYRLG